MREEDTIQARTSEAGRSDFDPARREDVMRWRKAERQRLIEDRLAMASDLRRRNSGAIAATVLDLLGDCRDLVVSAYWPFRGEPDLRGVMEVVWERGGRSALPLVVAKGQPLIFKCWKPGEPLDKGVWNIPIPATGPEVVPNVVISPVVGFDRRCYRLGYGGGFFDRTLAGMPAKPRVIGVGHARAEIPTIHALPHDIPMDLIVTEKESVEPVR